MSYNKKHNSPNPKSLSCKLEKLPNLIKNQFWIFAKARILGLTTSQMSGIFGSKTEHFLQWNTGGSQLASVTPHFQKTRFGLRDYESIQSLDKKDMEVALF